MALESGKYAPNNHRTVTVWRGPDKDGDGEDVWVDATDAQGRSLGRSRAKDKDGNEINHYKAPEGFRNLPTADRQDQWTKVNEDGSVYRNAAGEAVIIEPGKALVEYPDGSWELLPDEYAQYQFEQAHERVDTK
jgi:hypothetical protein